MYCLNFVYISYLAVGTPEYIKKIISILQFWNIGYMLCLNEENQ